MMADLNDDDFDQVMRSLFEDDDADGRKNPLETFEMVPVLSQFRPVDTTLVDQFLADSTNVNTRKKTESDMKLLNAYLVAKGEFRMIEYIPPDTLNDLLCSFLLSVQKKDGKEYEPGTLRGFLCSFDRHLLEKGSKVSIARDVDFAKTRQLLKAKQKTLKRDGYGNKPRTADPLTEEHLEKMHGVGTLGDQSPRALIHSMWLVCTTYFGMRTGKEVHDLRWGDVVLGVDERNGQEFLQLNTERQTKTRTGANPKDTRVLKPKAYAIPENPERDPVHLYKMFDEKRPEEMKTAESPFFLTPGAATQKCWFRKSAMGINKLYDIMNEMKQDAAIIAPRITPYSARKRLIQKLSDEGVPPNQIIQISGHKNVNSLNNYSKINAEQNRQISNILSNKENAVATVGNRSMETPSSSTEIPSSSTSQSDHNNPLPSGFFSNATFNGHVTFQFSSHRSETQSLTQTANFNSPPRHFKRIKMISDSDSD